MSATKVICPKCDSSYYDWGLYDPICKECGNNLESNEDDLADRIYDISVGSGEHKVPRTRDLEITIGR
jgi:predicted amidophosphoribosyltransferase